MKVCQNIMSKRIFESKKPEGTGFGVNYILRIIL
jgi:hypothetical protein